MQTFITIVKKLSDKAQTVRNLHRWGNHFDKECVGRIDNCMSMKWNDYSGYSRSDKLNEIQTRVIDEKYGHLYKICNNQPKTTPEIKKVMHSYNYKTFSKKDFEKYFYLEMRASMMI